MRKLLRPAKEWLKQLLGKVRQVKRQAEIRDSAPHIDRQTIVAGLRQMGIVPGDVVMLHSSLKSLGYVDGGPKAVLEAICEAISPGGTLVVPTYYLPGGTIYEACQLRDYVFDPRKHGTNLGALPAAFLAMPGVARSVHPTHSVSALGPQAQFITEAHHLAPSIFGEGSPWERCLQLNAKVLGLGISLGPVTFYHLLEDRELEKFPLPVRMATTYQMKCRDWQGNPCTVPVTPLDPIYAPRRIDHRSRDDLRTFLWQDFDAAGILRQGKVGQAGSWYIESQAFYNRLHDLMQHGITIYAEADELARFQQLARG